MMQSRQVVWFFGGQISWHEECSGVCREGLAKRNNEKHTAETQPRSASHKARRSRRVDGTVGKTDGSRKDGETEEGWRQGIKRDKDEQRIGSGEEGAASLGKPATTRSKEEE
jgi:hypothetical protein